MALSACERLHGKYPGLKPSRTVGDNGEQLRVTIPAGLVVATWVRKKERLAYSSGFLFGAGELKKLSARDVGTMLEAASSDEAASGRLL